MYAFLLVWPNSSTEIALGAPLTTAATTVTLLGSSGGPLPWRASNGTAAIFIDVASVRLHTLASRWIWAFKLENVIPRNITDVIPPGGGASFIFPSSVFCTLLCALYWLMIKQFK